MFLEFYGFKGSSLMLVPAYVVGFEFEKRLHRGVNLTTGTSVYVVEDHDEIMYLLRESFPNIKIETTLKPL